MVRKMIHRWVIYTAACAILAALSIAVRSRRPGPPTVMKIEESDVSMPMSMAPDETESARRRLAHYPTSAPSDEDGAMLTLLFWSAHADDEFSRRTAFDALRAHARRHPETRPAIQDFLLEAAASTNPDRHVAAACLDFDALDPAQRDRLSAFLTDESEAMRLAAVEAIGAGADPGRRADAVRLLKAAFLRETTLSIQTHIVRVLGSWARLFEGAEARRALQELVGTSTEIDPQIVDELRRPEPAPGMENP